MGFPPALLGLLVALALGVVALKAFQGTRTRTREDDLVWLVVVAGVFLAALAVFIEVFHAPI